MTNKAAVVKELVRDYEGTYRAWEEVSNKLQYSRSNTHKERLMVRANELREVLVGIRDAIAIVQGR